MKVYVIDTETTGQQEGTMVPEVIELAYAEVINARIQLSEIEVQRFKPILPITLGALAVHHILEKELLGLPSSDEAELPDDCLYIIGHNVDYDWKALGSPSDVKRICTLAMARRVWADDSHTLGACLYRILPHEEARERLKGAHGAKVDVENTWLLLQHFLYIKGGLLKSWGDVWAWSEDCRLPRIWTFGKHKGLKIGHELNGKADFGYHSWALRQPDMDLYVKKALGKFKEGTL